jgi:hypothetical protein
VGGAGDLPTHGRTLPAARPSFQRRPPSPNSSLPKKPCYATQPRLSTRGVYVRLGGVRGSRGGGDPSGARENLASGRDQLRRQPSMSVVWWGKRRPRGVEYSTGRRRGNDKVLVGPARKGTRGERTSRGTKREPSLGGNTTFFLLKL